MTARFERLEGRSRFADRIRDLFWSTLARGLGNAREKYVREKKPSERSMTFPRRRPMVIATPDAWRCARSIDDPRVRSRNGFAGLTRGHVRPQRLGSTSWHRPRRV